MPLRQTSNQSFGHKKFIKKYTINVYPETVLTTYCAKGVVRREMQAVGFKMERIPGPPGKKRCYAELNKRILSTCSILTIFVPTKFINIGF